jgi:hypothetical protein
MNITRQLQAGVCSIAVLGFTGVAQAEVLCMFDTDLGPGLTVPDGVSDSSGHGNLSCADFIGANNQPMIPVTGIILNTDGSWVLPESEWSLDGNNYVTNTPDHVILLPSGKGSQCDFIYLKHNAVAGAGLHIQGTVDTADSFACTDNIANAEEISQVPDVITNADICDVTLKENGVDRTTDFDVVIGTNLEGTTAAVCNPGGNPVNECVLACPEFQDVDLLQQEGLCMPGPGGWIPLYDGEQRCTPCLTAAEAEDQIGGFDAEGNKLCWEYSNRVNLQTGSYRPHAPVRSQNYHTKFYNECTETTTTVMFFGREITKTITNCN